MKLLSLFLLLLCYSTPIHALTPSQILIGNWQVITQAGITCNPTNCCCFNGMVNGYMKNIENYLNGTATGICRKATQQDNLDPPTTYNFTEEFLGIDNAHFTLSNLTYNTQSGISLTMDTTGTAKPTCGFQIWKPSTTGLPTIPETTTTTIAAPMISAYVQAFVGTWYADNTCATFDTTCCCLTNQVNISMSPTQASAFTITGTPSIGCGINTPTETDDFPWPVDAYTADNGYNVSLLVNADEYIVDYSVGMGGAPNTIAFGDATRSQCSFKLQSTPSPSTTSPPTQPPKNWAPQAHQVSAPLVITVLAILVALYH